MNIQTATRFQWKYIFALNNNFRRNLQIKNFISSICLCGSSSKDVFSHYIAKCFEKLIASDKNYWKTCTVAHIKLKLHKMTGWFIILYMNVTQCVIGSRMVVLSSNATLNKLILQTRCHSNHLTSLKKSALIQNPAAQIPGGLN